METDFAKSEGLGNDFIIIEDLEDRLRLAPEVVARLCDRHFGIGADGLILVNKKESGRYFMNLRNADGSVAEMSGNGIRVFAKYVYERLMPETAMEVETLAGVKIVEVRVDAGRVGSVTVDMGPPKLKPEEIPVKSDGNDFIARPLDLAGGNYEATCVSMGNPHCVLFVANAMEAPVTAMGPIVEGHSLFPQKTNVEFVEVVSPDRLRVRVWERGVGETMACGTGACAALVAARLNGVAGRQAVVVLPGGELAIEWREDNHVVMAGPAREVYTGRVDLSEFGRAAVAEIGDRTRRHD